MDFLEKVKEVASSIAAVSVRKGKEFRDIAKIKLEIADKQNKVKNLYKEIGFEAYKAFKRDGQVMEAIKEMLENIDSYEEEIAVLRKKIDDIKNTEEVGVEDVPAEDSEAIDADVYDGQSEYDESETEPID